MTEQTLVTTDFQTLDRLDEDQILAELQGAVLDTYVYSFQQGGKTVTGLSWAGVKAVASKMGAVAVEMLQLIETDLAYKCITRATAPDGSSRIGAAEQFKVISTRNGTQDDPFALTKCVSKSQRNAMRHLIPETLVVEIIKEAQQKGQPRKVSTTKPAQPAPSANAAGQNGGEVPTSPAALLAYVNQNRDDPFDNLYELRAALTKAGLEGSGWGKVNDLEWWKRAKTLAIGYKKAA